MEAGVTERDLDREDRAGDRAKYLEMWAGKGEFTYDRIGRGTVRISSNTLAILGGIQPDVLMAYLREAVRGGAGNDGLLQRLQMSFGRTCPENSSTLMNGRTRRQRIKRSPSLNISTTSRRNKPERTHRRRFLSCVLPMMLRSVSMPGAPGWKRDSVAMSSTRLAKRTWRSIGSLFRLWHWRFTWGAQNGPSFCLRTLQGVAVGGLP